MTSSYDLVLDPAIRNWVVLPMIILMTLVGLGRSYAQQLMRTEPKIGEKEFDEIRYKQNLGMAERLRVMGNLINKRAFDLRKSYLHNKKPKPVTNKDGTTSESTNDTSTKTTNNADLDDDDRKGILQEKVEVAANPMMSGDPSQMINMVKNQAVFMVPNMGMMAFVNYFFQGFVCLKVPFSLPSDHFKSMLQRGVDISTLDVSFVSSISWYILLTFGLNGVYRLILDEGTEIDESKMMQMQMQMGAGGGGMGFDANAAYKQARQALSISKNHFIQITEQSEKNILGKNYPAPPVDNAANVDLSKFN
jgi:ER membrane protein complex subunit 3